MKPESFVVIPLPRPQRLLFPFAIPRFGCLLYLEIETEEEMGRNRTKQLTINQGPVVRRPFSLNGG